ncbi:MAG: SDR family oxidoreductase [Planctomycetota bacterium]|nr:SDR family oxidoreductase [Planctomycetota bacterium]
MSLRDKVVWITGASSGIGLAATKEFLKRDAFVIVSARRKNELEKLAGDAAPGRVHVLPVDLSQADQLDEICQKALAWKGRVDVLVNNAGISQRSLALETDLQTCRKIMELNFFAPVALCQGIVPSMIENKDGRIVIVSSVAGFVGTPKRSSYSASKHACQGWFDSLRAELDGTGVSVTVVAPGYVSTDITQSALTGQGEKHGQSDQGNAQGITPEACAQTLVKATERRQREVYIGGKETYAIYLKRWFPGLVAKIVPGASPK